MRWIDLERFDGGLVNVLALGIGAESLHMSRYGQNVRTRTGAVESREGIIDYCDFSLAVGVTGETLQALYEYSRENVIDGASLSFDYILFSFGGDSLYYVDVDDDPDAAVVISTSMLSDDIYCVNAFDHIFVANGRDELMTWDAQSWYQAGIDPPAAPTVGGDVPGGGNEAITGPNGYRTYKYTYYRAASGTSPFEKESEASDDLVAGPYTDRQVIIHMTAPTDAQVTHYRLYATKEYAAGSPLTDFYLVNDQLLAAGTAITDNVDDADLEDNLAYDTTDRTVSPKVKYLLWHDNRLYGAGIEDDPSIIHWTAPGKPFYWPEDNWDEVSRDDGDVITGLASIGPARFIFKTNSIFDWVGDPDSSVLINPVERPNASMNQTRVGVGCRDPRSLCAWGNSLIFRAADDHVYMVTMDRIIQLSRYVSYDIALMGTDAKAAVHNDYYIIRSGDETMVCDLRKGQQGWQGWDTNVKPNGCLIDHNGYFLGTEGDKIIRYYTGTDDNGAAIAKKFKTAYAKVGRGKQTGIFRKIIPRMTERSASVSVIPTYDDATAPTITYSTTDIHAALDRGRRGNYLAAEMQWSGTGKIHSVALGYLLSRRH